MARLPASDSVLCGQLLLIDREERTARQTGAALSRAMLTAPEVVVVEGGRSAAERLRRERFDIIIADLESLADLAMGIEDAILRLVKLAQGALILAIADGASVSTALVAMRAGAHDYVSKPISPEALAARIGELAHRHGRSRALAAEPATGPAVADFAGFVGSSSAMQFLYEQISRVAASAAPVFITGESGTGKDVCAEALHAQGPRSNKRFVAINCAAIPRDLMESELFGVTRGAFTGAHEDRKGAAELADGGTLFLDEIGEMDLSLQSKLLRFLQTGMVSRVGEVAARKVDVRVICATNRNPMQMIADRLFREDLFYRLHVLPIHLPPLRQRPTDIMVLARHFLARYAAEEHKQFAGFSADAAQVLAGAEWPGNVRQLQNLIRRIVVMFDGEEIDATMLMAADIESQAAAPSPVEPPRPDRSRQVLPMWQQEQRIIEDAIETFGGNISMAAAALQISPSTIYRKRQSWAEMAVAS
ncbi:sigma-54-dependent Fis family transcriptional regulator [Devosia sp. PTR5]|uniref:Sigma-54-dependent Fis family transcriptional regulator n=1 Tax=Devosia oryzisoli TaxID=2774138 RepID=A0A927ITC8_9HYPH|nr:sigma-54 dependent transcriptional regulator [Devosia oryzisoli]MBD8065566.1 sigma-54-dependent Fis family transcriptional regulator [Devosia oryzisoli]